MVEIQAARGRTLNIKISDTSSFGREAKRNMSLGGTPVLDEAGARCAIWRTSGFICFEIRRFWISVFFGIFGLRRTSYFQGRGGLRMVRRDLFRRAMLAGVISPYLATMFGPKRSCLGDFRSVPCCKP